MECLISPSVETCEGSRVRGISSGVLALELHISGVLWDWLDWEEQDGIWSLVLGCLLLLHVNVSMMTNIGN